ncbi:hypothetical protein LPC10_19290 [Methylorubrum sp. B1-46]|uniref:hypothetical protein n=1 Tax=Methylorubrum sp. B1-46 TaxID=2897334 RepID=UPI001E325C0A|nr:hypothetical protein [Methylorubrum sp. B1-46]UGB25034.1 hypothetical protein LPC10_19290 [Methylorubrum sp. B1-46]
MSEIQRQVLNKVPEVTAAFWVIKILSTTVGETGADYLAVNVGLGAAVTATLTAGLLAAVLALQVRERRYVPWTYWSTVVLVSVVGTQVTDILTDKLGVSLFVSTGVFAAALAAVFALWYATERTLSIHAIVTRRREAFYWLAILQSFQRRTTRSERPCETSSSPPSPRRSSVPRPPPWACWRCRTPPSERRPRRWRPRSLATSPSSGPSSST